MILSRPSRQAASQTMKKRLQIGILVVLILAGLPGCQSGHGGKVDTIKLGALPGSPILMYIANDQHFFADNDLIVNIKDDYPSGAATTEAVLKGEMDLAWTAEFPMVSRAFEKQPLSIIACVGRFTSEFLFARKDQGIAAISDLTGKKIGVSKDTIGSFYLARFLSLNGVNPQEVSLVNIPVAESPAQIANGNLDAVVAWDPYGSQIQAQEGDRIVTWPIQSNQPGYGLVVARNEWIKASPDTASRFLKSLAQAVDYAVHNPEAAMVLTQKYEKLDDAAMQRYWSEIELSLTLDQSLVLAMEDEARWMIENNLTSNTHIPNFLDYIHENALKAIKPEEVNIIR